MKMSWEKEKVLNFIKEYEKRPVLWKKTDQFYFSFAKKEDAWREISTIMDEDPEILKKKMESLRGSRRREKHRYLKSLTSDHKDVYISRWFAWESLKFLDEADEIKISFSNPGFKKEIEDEYENSEQNNFEENLTRSEEDFEQTSGISNIDDVADSDEKTHRIEKVYSTEKAKAEINQFWSHRRKSRKRITHDTRVEKAYRVLKNRGAYEDRDDCSLFAEFIAEKLRKFDGRQRAILQHEIHNLVFQAEIEPVP